MAQSAPTPTRRRVFFVSWRWRLIIPLAIVLTLMAMAGAYLVALRFGGGVSTSQDNILLEAVRGVNTRTGNLYQRQLQEAQRIAFTVGVPEAVARNEVDVLQDTLEATARVANLDSVILTDVNGVEVLGVQRVSIPDVDDYAVNSGTALADQQLVADALTGTSGSSGLVRTPEGILLFVSTPLRSDDQIVGTVLAGNNMDALTAELQGSAVAQVAIYGGEAQLLQTSLDLDDPTRQALTLDTALQRQALATDGRNVPVRSLTISGVPHRAAYIPLNYGQSTLGVVAVLIPDNLPFATGVARQLTAVMAAGIAGMAVVVTFVGVAAISSRTERVQRTAEALAAGHKTARTRMRPVDEAGAAGAALDQYANRVLREQNAMQQTLQRQRRETNHLASVLTALPDGVIVQDTAGNLTFVNEAARRLLNTSTNIQENFARMIQKISGSNKRHTLAPGFYAIGDPQRIEMGEKMLNAQAAAITSVSGEQVGTVIVMRDMTEMVRQEQRRERLLQAVEEQVQAPLQDIARASAYDDTPLDDFTREITKRAVALQKLVVEMREITTVDVDEIQQVQKQIRLDTFIWAVANEWRQIAQAAGLQFYVSIERNGMHVLGEERRLRWAVGNIIDNAIKYTPPGGSVTLEVTGESKGQALMRVRDNGAGIAAAELPHVTTRFYRGNPVTKTGAIIRTPGMGQGLHTAEQIFKAHGGFLRVRSKPSIGTAVYFSLPVTSAQSLDLPRLQEDFEGETVKLPENQFPDLRL